MQQKTADEGLFDRMWPYVKLIGIMAATVYATYLLIVVTMLSGFVFFGWGR